MTTPNATPNPTEAMHSRMLQLRGDLAVVGAEPPAALEETFEAFGVTLEELRVTEESLLQTNEALLATRHQLDAERRRYRELFDRAPDAYLVTDPDGVILDANRAAAALLNVPQRFVEGKLLANFVAEPGRRAFRAALAAVGPDTRTARLRFPLRPRRGEVAEVETAVSPAATHFGRLRDILWLFRPEAPRGLPDAEAPAAERDRLLELIDSLGVVVWEADPGTARLTFVSREIEAYIGRPAETCLDAPGGWTDLVHPDDRTVLTALRARQLADRTDLEVEYRLVAPDGWSVWVREISRYSPAANGEPETLRGVLTNVNKRKKMERRLHYARVDVETEVRDLRFLQELCERLSLSFALPDVLDEILSALSSVLGSEMGSVSFYDPDRDEIRIAASAGVPDDFPAAIGGKRPGETPCSQALTEGRSVWFEDIATAPEYEGVRGFYLEHGVFALFATPLLSHTGEPIGVLSAYFGEPHRPAERPRALVELYARQAGQILANARRHAEVVDAEREKDDFLAVVGHGLRGPLEAMGPALKQLEEACGGDEASRAPREALARQVRHLARIAEDLLDVSRLDHEAHEGDAARADPTDPVAAVASGVETARPLFEALSHRLTVDVPTAAPLRIEADPARLARVVVNLLNNAARFTPPGGSVSVRLGREGDEAVLRVSDNGVGIAPELLDRVFDRFGRGDDSGRAPHRGIGIGLALVKKIVELYGGTVRVASPGVGHGCEVTVRLPVAGGR